jgi:predicted glycoside hydrolase/deacetylase ChbG (UPF0249 family)
MHFNKQLQQFLRVDSSLSPHIDSHMNSHLWLRMTNAFLKKSLR